MSHVFDGQVEAGIREGSAIVAAGADDTAVALATNGWRWPPTRAGRSARRPS